MPEFQNIAKLFERARKGIAFKGKTKEAAAYMLKGLNGLREFDRILQLFRIFQLLSVSEEYTLLDASPIVDAREEKDMNRLQKVYQFLEENYTHRIDIGEVSKAVNLSTPAFCRFFKKQSGITFTQFVNQFRISRSRKLLLQQKTVTEACYASGFDNLSYFNRTFKKITGENPSHFRRKFAAG
jgi:AraC-like DNA-binding protein